MSQMTIFDYFEVYKQGSLTKLSNYQANSKYERERLKPVYEYIKKLNNLNKAIDFFKKPVYLGKCEHVPYADFRKFFMGEKGCLMMLTIDSFRDFLFILNHSPQVLGGFVSLDDLSYTPCMSADKFRESLTDNEKEEIINDLERFVHRGPSNIEYVKKVMNDYRIDIPEKWSDVLEDKR